MKCGEAGFRAFYHNLCAVPVKESFRDLLEGFSGGDKTEYVLTYGYIDHEEGLTLEVLAAAEKNGDGFDFGDANNEISAKIRIGSVLEEEFYYFDDEDDVLRNHYARKIQTIDEEYTAADAVIETRKIDMLDNSRSAEYPDDVIVYMLKDGNQLEACWVRMEDIKEETIIGTLLNEPNQDFGCHEDDSIEFFIYKNKEGELMCVADRNLMDLA